MNRKAPTNRAGSAQLYYEDLSVGQRFGGSRPFVLSEEEIIAFARQYDPQFFHTDPEAAKHSVFGALAASGWQVAVLAMRAFVDEFANQIVGGVVGMDAEGLRWLLPVYPGDRLVPALEITAMRVSESRPSHGIVTMAWTVTNQDGRTVMQAHNHNWIARRPTPCVDGTGQNHSTQQV